MRRSAWTIGAAVLAALSLGVAACGGSDSDSRTGDNTNDRHGASRGREDGRQADGPVDRRRRSHRLRPDLLPDGQFHLQRDAEAAVLLQAGRRRDDGPGPRRRRSAGLRGRQDRHGQDQGRRQVLAAVRDQARSRPRTSSTRSSAASSPPSPPASRSPTTRTSRAPRSASRPARRSPASDAGRLRRSS